MTFLAGDVLTAANLNDFSPGGNIALLTGKTITWNGDTNIYRSAANVLATDDDFKVVGSISVPRGMISWGNRTTTSSNATSSTAVGVLRLDSISVTSGRRYCINVSGHPTSSVGTDNLRVEVRGTTSGTATTSSSVLASGQMFTTPQQITMRFVYPASSTATLSILLCVARDTGSGNCNFFTDSNRNTELWVEDLGVVSDTGVDV